MKDITLLAIDVAKNVFQLHGIDTKGKAVLKKRLTRAKLPGYISQLPACEIVMECCGSSHYWGRVFMGYGHEVKLISPQYVKPFVKGNKNDANDAEAIAEAASRPSMRFVSVKTVEQQDMQLLHRIREGYVRERVRLSNQIRGILLEYGIALPKGFARLRQELREYLEPERVELTEFMKAELRLLLENFLNLDKQIKGYDKKLKALVKVHEPCGRLMELSGVGPQTATAMVALGDVRHLKNGRSFAAFLGLVPRQNSSGNKQRLGRISKRGDEYIRRLLIHGARSSLLRLGDKTDAKSLWLKSLIQRRGMNRAAVALANKHARIIWHLLVSGEGYNPELMSNWKAAA